ncbi:MAG: hypothetical protein E6Q95_05430 [Chitinophagaceae bacterium]|nr:MAG: hypothetical protein E6Q95_05430 [Chitinophagaceae bacterium]
MTPKSDIILLQRHEIDDILWNNCVLNSSNGLIYSTTQYLDAVVKDWIGLIYNNYQSIFPIPIKKKWGISYIPHPMGISQLGITGSMNDNITFAFINFIQKHFKYGSILFNEWISDASIQNHQLERKTNYILPLTESYETIYARFTKDAKKNIRFCKGLHTQSIHEINTDDLVNNYLIQYGSRNQLNRRSKEIKNYIEALSFLQNKNMAFTSGIINDKNELLVSGFFGKFKNRIYYLFAAPSVEGRKLNITHLLINNIIEENANSSLIFDFEGSSIPSVAQFYKKFSPIEKRYAVKHLNHFPSWTKWLKH